MLFHGYGSAQSSQQSSRRPPAAPHPPLPLAKPRLPKIQPNVNKRAQQLVASQLRSHSVDSANSSTATIPVLAQIDNTAPRTARTHDISHLRDASTFLTPAIPPTLIDEKDHRYEPAFLPVDSTSAYNEEDGMWYTKVFPSSNPSSRNDAVMLDEWINANMMEYQKMTEGHEDLVRAVDDLVPILTVALHEIVRQVIHHCAERGVVLKKIWQTYIELFDRVLRQMQEALKDQKRKTLEVQEVLRNAKDQLDAVRRSHPEQMQKVIADLEVRFTKRQTEVEQELLTHEEENEGLKRDLRQHHSELELWYPSFQLYQDSYIKSHIPQYIDRPGPNRGRHSSKRRPSANHEPVDQEGEAEEEVAPEVAIAEDFKRLLAVLGPEKRRLIGKELNEVLNPAMMYGSPTGKNRKNAPLLDDKDAAAQQEEEQAIAGLKKEVSSQEDKIRELREKIASLERAKEERSSVVSRLPPRIAVGADDGDE